MPYNLLNPSAGSDVPAEYPAHDFKELMLRGREAGVGVIGIRVLAAGALSGEATYINGKCSITMDGSNKIGFEIAANGYVAQVDDIDAADIEGFWNEEQGSSHLHSRLGTLTQKGACWTNEKTENLRVALIFLLASPKSRPFNLYWALR
jgi:hypothetical protein